MKYNLQTYDCSDSDEAEESCALLTDGHISHILFYYTDTIMVKIYAHRIYHILCVRECASPDTHIFHWLLSQKNLHTVLLSVTFRDLKTIITVPDMNICNILETIHWISFGYQKRSNIEQQLKMKENQASTQDMKLCKFFSCRNIYNVPHVCKKMLLNIPQKTLLIFCSNKAFLTWEACAYNYCNVW